MAILGITGVWGACAGLVYHNEVYYLAADAFHWYFEILFIGFLSYTVFCRMAPGQMIGQLARGSALLGGVGVVIWLVGTLGGPIHAGGMVPTLGIWRLELARSFPFLPLIVTLGALTSPVPQSPSTRKCLWCANVLLVVCLAVSLKRTQWIAVLGVLPILFGPRRLLRPFLVAGFASVTIAAVMVALWADKLYTAVPEIVDNKLTYNSHWTVQDTLSSRSLQYEGLLDHVNRPLGHGFGATFRTWIPIKRYVAETHYVHNMYLYYGLHLGVGVLLPLLALGKLMADLWRVIARCGPWEWGARTALASLLAAGAGGLTLVPTHSAFSGLILGLACYVVHQHRLASHTAAAAVCRPRVRARKATRRRVRFRRVTLTW
jgi:hypothetical protein